MPLAIKWLFDGLSDPYRAKISGEHCDLMTASFRWSEMGEVPIRRDSDPAWRWRQGARSQRTVG